MRGGLADVAYIKGQVPLPETADELCAVAQDMKAQTGRDILLGAKATEREVKRLSAAGELAKYRVVHFATHGVLAGVLTGTPRAGPDPDPARHGDRGGRRLSVGVGDCRPEARRGLGDPVGLQHGGRRGRRTPRRCRAWRGLSSTRRRGPCWSRTGRCTRTPR